VTVFCYRSLVFWLLGYPEAALADSAQALTDAREIGQAATLMHALLFASLIHIHGGKTAAANALVDELVAIADEKGGYLWKASAMLNRGCLFALTGKADDAIQITTSALKAWRSTGATVWVPMYLSHLASAHAQLDQIDDAWRFIGEAMTAVEITKQRWFEAEANRIAGEIALISPEQDAAKAQAYFDRALVVARKQQAKSWELRAAMSMARLWRDQGKRDEARELLAPVYD